MRIDLIITEMFVGGAEKCLTELAIGLAKRGDEVRVFSIGSLPTGDQAALVNRLDDARIPIDGAHADGWTGLPRTISRLKTWLGSSPPDLVQTFLFHANLLGTFATQSSILGAGLDCPVIGGLRVADPNPLRNRLERQAVARMSRLVCVSSATSRFAAEHLRCPDGKRLVIPNAIDVDHWTAAPPLDWQSLGWPSDSVVTLFVGRLHPQKNLGVLQRNFDAIVPAGSNRRLLLIGDGPERDAMHRWAESVGDDRVRCLPWQKDVRPYVRAARLLVLPSLYEGMPNVVLEAMAAGIAVVTSRVEGSEELIGPTRDDQSFELGDEAALVTRVNRFLSDEGFARQVGDANQRRARESFSIESMVEQYQALYRDCLL